MGSEEIRFGMGIEAPSNVRIYREEIFHQILEENQSAATDLPSDLIALAKVWSDGRNKALVQLKNHKLKNNIFRRR